jgi:hypothetical protein
MSDLLAKIRPWFQGAWPAWLAGGTRLGKKRMGTVDKPFVFFVSLV